MKITKQHYAELERAVLSAQMQTASLNAYLAAGATAKRWRWDLLYRSRLRIGDGRGMDELPLYAYMDDTHIDTALRAITNTR